MRRISDAMLGLVGMGGGGGGEDLPDSGEHFLVGQRVRKEFWGYAPDENLDNDALIQEKYRGIRPAPGYPACPEHTEKQAIWDLLDVEANTGMQLTESMAMWPGASVSGLFFAHPDSRYFVLGRINRDQIADYARRKGWEQREAERWLAPNLAYEPED